MDMGGPILGHKRYVGMMKINKNMVNFNKIGTSENGGYSIFENPDKELVEKIKQVTLDEDVDLVHDGANGVFRAKKTLFKVNSKLSETQLLCQYIGEFDNYFILDIDKFEELKINLLKDKINTLYPPAKHAYFIDLVYNYKGQSNTRFELKKLTDFLNTHSYSIWVYEIRGTMYSESSWNKYVSYKRSNGGHTFFCYFDFNGNYNVRDYNLNFNNINQENISSDEEIIENCIESLFSIEKPTELEYFGSNWYTENFMYSLVDYDNEVKIEVTPKRFINAKGVIEYKPEHRGKSVKKPSKKNLVTVDFNHMAEAFRNRIIKIYEITKE